MASSIAGPSQPRPRPRPPRLEGQADDAAAAAAVAQMPRRGGTSNATPISLETFQSTTFDVSQFVTQLMDDNVKRGTKDATGSSGGQSPSLSDVLQPTRRRLGAETCWLAQVGIWEGGARKREAAERIIDDENRLDSRFGHRGRGQCSSHPYATGQLPLALKEPAHRTL
jgi:hypothetical protein